MTLPTLKSWCKSFHPGRVGMKQPIFLMTGVECEGQQPRPRTWGATTFGEKLLGVTWNLFAPRIQHISYSIYYIYPKVWGLWIMRKSMLFGLPCVEFVCVPMYAMPGDRFIARALYSLSQLNKWSFRQMISPYVSIWARSEAMNRFRVKEGTEDQFEQRWGKDRSIASCLTQRKKIWA